MKRTISLSLMCLSTTKPGWIASAKLSRSVTNSSRTRRPSGRTIYSAPGYWSGPFRIRFLSSSIFQGVTRSGIVSLWATSIGTPTSLMSMLGSGEITVLAEKSTRFPERFPLNRPSLPFSRWVRVFRALPDLWRAGGNPDTSLSKYVVT